MSDSPEEDDPIVTEVYMNSSVALHMITKFCTFLDPHNSFESFGKFALFISIPTETKRMC